MRADDRLWLAFYLGGMLFGMFCLLAVAESWISNGIVAGLILVGAVALLLTAVRRRQVLKGRVK